MSREPQSLVLELLRNIRADVARVDGKVDAVKVDLQSEIHSLRADVAADFVTIRREMGEQIAGLRRAVVEYHSAVLGHGVPISELEARVRRIEQHSEPSRHGRVRVTRSRKSARQRRLEGAFCHGRENGDSVEPRAAESVVLELLRNIRADVARVDGKVDALKVELRSEMRSLRADVAADFLEVNATIDTLRKETSEQIVGLRRAVVEYHSAVLGHGVLISELEARVRRIEQHLSLPGMDAN